VTRYNSGEKSVHMALSPTIRAIQPQHRRPFVPKTIYTLSSTNLSQIFSITLKPLYPILNHYTNLQPSNRTPILPRVHPATTMARTCSHAPSSVASRPLIPRRSQRISNALKITKPSSPTPKQSKANAKRARFSLQTLLKKILLW
jgi:hypothetical protein